MTSQRITILAQGTRGDVEPMIALAVELKRRGHAVRLAAPEAFVEFIGRHGLEAWRLRCGMDAMLASRRLWKYHRFGFFSRWLYIHDIQQSIGARAFEDAKAACEGSQAILFHPMMPFATDIAEALDVPCIMAAFQPLTATAEFPLFSLTSSTHGGWFNRLSYRLTPGPYAWYARRINRARRRLLGLRRRKTFADPLRVRGQIVPAVYGISRWVVPQPADWGPDALIAGYWFLPPDETWTPPENLAEFLAAGPPPLYVGFGSNPIASPARLVACVGEALRLSGERAVLSLGRVPGAAAVAGVDAALLHIVGPVPHGWLFARVGAAVHHGGAGTVAASLKAGLATLICPLLIDQFWWGERIHAIGAGPEPLPSAALSAPALAERIRDLVGNPDYARTARRIAAGIAGEDGPGRAADFIEARLAF